MTDPRMWSSGQKILGLVGVLVLAAAVFQGLENLAGRGSSSTSNYTATGPSEPRPPVRPTLERVDDWTITIREGKWSRTNYRFNESDDIELADAVYACLEEGIARDFDDNPTTSHSEMRSRTKKIREQCSVRVIRAVPPVPVLSKNSAEPESGQF